MPLPCIQEPSFNYCFILRGVYSTEGGGAGARVSGPVPPSRISWMVDMFSISPKVKLEKNQAQEPGLIGFYCRPRPSADNSQLI